jgi:hypothetical protein
VWGAGWISDSGTKPKKQVKGCGMVRRWSFSDSTDIIEVDGSSNKIGTYQADYFANKFDLMLAVGGCVGRAIKSAGARSEVGLLGLLSISAGNSLSGLDQSGNLPPGQPDARTQPD